MAPKPKAKGRQLKVYWAEIDGLNEWIVAAPNRPEALKAFGVRQDLFAQGEAGEADDPGAAKAARAAPLTPLRRPKGSSKPYAPATGASDWSVAIPKTKAKPKAEAGAGPPCPGGEAAAPTEPPKPKPDRRPLDRAQARLAEVETRHRDALQRLAEDRARLDERQARENADYLEDAAQAKREVEQAEQAWRDAGGR